MISERFAFRAAVYLLLVRNCEVLLSRRFNTGWQDGKYSMVAGHADGNESISAALIREAKEEADLVIDQADVRVLHTMHRRCDDGLEYLDFFAEAERWTGKPRIMEPDKCDDLRWFRLDDLPENTLDYVRQALQCVGNGVHYSEFGW